MAFEGIIPWLRDYKNRNSMDQFLGKYGVALQSGDPDAIAKIPVDPRNPYQQQAVSQALQAWNTAGQGGLIRANTAHTGAQTGLVNQQTRNAGQAFDINAANEQRTNTAEGWLKDTFQIPNAQAFNMSLQDRSAKVGERNAATHEGQLGVQQADQKAKFAGNRAAGLAIGMNPMDLTQPMDIGPMLQWQQLQEGDKNRENLRQVNELSQLGHLLSNQQLYMDPQQGPALLQEMRRRMRIPDAPAAQQNSRGEVIQNATQDLAEKNLTFGRNTPPLNMQDVGSNFQGLERPLMGTRQLLHTIGLADDPLQTEVRPQYPQRGERNASLPNDLLFQQPPRVQLNQPTNQAPQQVFTPPPITNNPPAFNPASVAIPPAPPINNPRLTNFNVNSTSPEQAGTPNPTLGEPYQFPLWQRMIQDFLSQKPSTNQMRRAESPRTSMPDTTAASGWTPPPITNNPPRFDPAMYNPAPPTNIQFQVPQTTGINQVGQIAGMPTPTPISIPAMTNQNPQLQMTQQDIFRDVAQRYQQQSPNEQFKQMQSMTPEQQAMLLQMIADLMGGQPQQR